MNKGDRAGQLTEEFKVGADAKKLLNNKVWRQTVEDLRNSYIRSIESGSWLKKRAREENCRRLQVLNDIVATIEIKHERGEQARKRLEANNGSK